MIKIKKDNSFGAVCVLMVLCLLNTSILASMLDSRYYISGYVGSNKGNTKYDQESMVQDKSYKFDFSNLAQYGLDFGVRIGDTPWAISAGYFLIGPTTITQSQNYPSMGAQVNVDVEATHHQHQHRLGARWMHDFSKRLSVYVGGGLANYNFKIDIDHKHKAKWLGTTVSSSGSSTTNKVSQVGLYSEVSGIISITDQLYTGIRLDYSFANGKYASQPYEVSAISYGVVAGFSF